MIMIISPLTRGTRISKCSVGVKSMMIKDKTHAPLLIAYCLHFFGYIKIIDLNLYDNSDNNNDDNNDDNDDNDNNDNNNNNNNNDNHIRKTRETNKTPSFILINTITFPNLK